MSGRLHCAAPEADGAGGEAWNGAQEGTGGFGGCDQQNSASKTRHVISPRFLGSGGAHLLQVQLHVFVHKNNRWYCIKEGLEEVGAGAFSGGAPTAEAMQQQH